MGKLLVVKVKEKGRKGSDCYEYSNSVNLSDPNILAMILLDLINNFNAPIVKAFERLQEMMGNRKKRNYPFLQ